MVTCREFVEFLMAYLDGELPETERVEFDRHLALCPTCVAYLQTYRDTIGAGKAAFSQDDEPPEEAPEELVEAILKVRSGRA